MEDCFLVRFEGWSAAALQGVALDINLTRWMDVPPSLMITITVLMFVFSTVHILLSVRAGITAFCGQTPGSHALIESPNDPTVWIQLLLELLNVSTALCTV